MDSEQQQAEKQALDIIKNPGNPSYKIYYGPSGAQRTQMREHVNKLLQFADPGTTPSDDGSAAVEQKRIASNAGRHGLDDAQDQ